MKKLQQIRSENRLSCKKARILLLITLISLTVFVYNFSGVLIRNVNLRAEVVNIHAHTIIQHYHGNHHHGNHHDNREIRLKQDNRTTPQANHGVQTARESKHHKNRKNSTNHYHKKAKHDSRHFKLCGSGWQDRYARLHRNIITSKQEGRYLAYTCPAGYRQGCCGYGNRLRAVVSLFYLAVLTDRAFLIDWRAPEPIQDHLTPKHIQWNYSAPLDICTGLETRRHYWGTARTDLRRAEGWIIQDSRHFKNWFVGTDLSRYFDTLVEVISTIWYFVEGGVDKNPYLMKRAKELRITPLLSHGPKYALIGCAFDFLFKKSSVVESHLKFWRETLYKGNGPTIGIHIRTGDSQFDYYASNDDRSFNLINASRLNRFFWCARNVEKTLLGNANPRNIQWFLASDHVKVKEFARKKFPGKVVTTNLTIQHLDILYNTTTVFNDTLECNFTTGVNGTVLCYNVVEFNKTDFCTNRTNHTTTDYTGSPTNNTHQFTAGIIAMLVDHFILSECDFLILCDSSFSSTAVGLSMRGADSFVLGDHDCLGYKQARRSRKMRFFRRKRSIESFK